MIASDPTPELLASLRLGEGFRAHAYPDPKSGGAPWTIGYGHTGFVRPGDICSEAEAEARLVKDATKAVRLVLAELPWSAHLDQVRFDVLAEMTFNMGWRSVDAGGHVHGLSGFVHTLGLVEAGDYAGAAGGMLASGWARDVGARARRLAEQMRTGKRA